MITPSIEPHDLILFNTYLTDLEQYGSNGEQDHIFYKRWKSQIDSITQTASKLDIYLEAKDSTAAQQVRYSKHLQSFHDNEYTVYKKHVHYYLAGIKKYQQEVEDDLIQNGLLNKSVQEMTGLEFRTLLLSTLREYQNQQKQ